jgi:hypothetical protein
MESAFGLVRLRRKDTGILVSSLVELAAGNGELAVLGESVLSSGVLDGVRETSAQVSCPLV